MKLLENKVCLITGAASGIGRASALLFARHGGSVIVADLNEPEGKGTVADIEAEGGSASFIRADVSRAEDVERMIEETVREHGRIDVLQQRGRRLHWAAPQDERGGLGPRDRHQPEGDLPRDEVRTAEDDSAARGEHREHGERGGAHRRERIRAYNAAKGGSSHEARGGRLCPPRIRQRLPRRDPHADDARFARQPGRGRNRARASRRSTP
jgi:hypothetical protein